MSKNNKNQTIKRQKFEAPLDQILHILNSTINTEYEQFFGNKKYIGWFNQQDKVVDAKIALCNLLDEVIELKSRVEELNKKKKVDDETNDLINKIKKN